jgi:uncharacterized protein
MPDNLDPAAAKAVEIFRRQTRSVYGDGLLKIVLFGSRARGDAGPDSDVDLAVVLRSLSDRAAERNKLADIAYDAIVETSLGIQAITISEDEWEHPDRRRNPDLIRAIRRDGVVVDGEPEEG